MMIDVIDVLDAEVRWSDLGWWSFTPALTQSGIKHVLGALGIWWADSWLSSTAHSDWKTFWNIFGDYFRPWALIKHALGYDASWCWTNPHPISISTEVDKATPAPMQSNYSGFSLLTLFEEWMDFFWSKMDTTSVMDVSASKQQKYKIQML